MTNQSESKGAKNPPQSVMDEYNRKSAYHRRLICEALRASAHITDNDVLTVDGQHVGLFVIPNASHVFIGFGGTLGGRVAYRGGEDCLSHQTVADMIATYISEQQPATPTCPGQDPTTSKSTVDLPLTEDHTNGNPEPPPAQTQSPL